MLLITTALALAPSLGAETNLSGLEPSALTAFLAPAAQEEGRRDWNFSYTYLEIGAAQYDADLLDDEADVYYGKASAGLLEFLYVFGQYTNQSFDVGNVETDDYQFGVGAHFGVGPALDVYGEVAWLFNDISSDLGDNDDSGYGVEGGARWMAFGWDRGGVELDAAIGYYDIEAVADDMSVYWELGARFHFLEAFSVGLTYAMIEDDEQLSAGARFSF